MATSGCRFLLRLVPSGRDEGYCAVDPGACEGLSQRMVDRVEQGLCCWFGLVVPVLQQNTKVGMCGREGCITGTFVLSFTIPHIVTIFMTTHG